MSEGARARRWKTKREEDEEAEEEEETDGRTDGRDERTKGRKRECLGRNEREREEEKNDRAWYTDEGREVEKDP